MQLNNTLTLSVEHERPYGLRRFAEVQVSICFLVNSTDLIEKDTFADVAFGNFNFFAIAINLYLVLGRLLIIVLIRLVGRDVRSC